MPVDPQIQMLLDLGAGLPQLHTLSVEDARAQFAARDFAGLRKPEVASVCRTATCRDPVARWGCGFTPRWEGPLSADGIFPRQRVRFVQPGYP